MTAPRAYLFIRIGIKSLRSDFPYVGTTYGVTVIIIVIVEVRYRLVNDLDVVLVADKGCWWFRGSSY